MTDIREIARNNVVYETQSASNAFIITCAGACHNGMETSTIDLCTSGEAIGATAFKFPVKYENESEVVKLFRSCCTQDVCSVVGRKARFKGKRPFVSLSILVGTREWP